MKQGVVRSSVLGGTLPLSFLGIKPTTQGPVPNHQDTCVFFFLWSVQFKLFFAPCKSYKMKITKHTPAMRCVGFRISTKNVQSDILNLTTRCHSRLAYVDWELNKSGVSVFFPPPPTESCTPVKAGGLSPHSSTDAFFAFYCFSTGVGITPALFILEWHVMPRCNWLTVRSHVQCSYQLCGALTNHRGGRWSVLNTGGKGKLFFQPVPA